MGVGIFIVDPVWVGREYYSAAVIDYEIRIVERLIVKQALMQEVDVCYVH